MTDFPMFISDSIMKIFEVLREQVLLLLPLIFLIRLFMNFLLFKGKEDFLTLIKDVLLMWILLFLFSDFFKLVFEFPQFIGKALSDSKEFHVNLKGDNFITSYLSKLTDYVAIGSYWISYGFYILILAVLGLLASHFIFFSTMTSNYTGLKLFFSIFILTALWPVFWYGINFAIKNLLLTDNAFGNNMVLILGSVLKIIFPLIGSVSFLKMSFLGKLKSLVKVSNSSKNQENQNHTQNARSYLKNSSSRLRQVSQNISLNSHLNQSLSSVDKQSQNFRQYLNNQKGGFDSFKDTLDRQREEFFIGSPKTVTDEKTLSQKDNKSSSIKKEDSSHDKNQQKNKGRLNPKDKSLAVGFNLSGYYHKGESKDLKYYGYKTKDIGEERKTNFNKKFNYYKPSYKERKKP